MATEFSQPIFSNNLSNNNNEPHSFFTGTIKSEFKTEQSSIALNDFGYERLFEQVPSFDQYLTHNIHSSYNNSYEFSIAPSLLHSPISCSLLSSDSLSLSSIASVSSTSSSCSLPVAIAAAKIIQIPSSSMPPPILRPQTLSPSSYVAAAAAASSSLSQTLSLACINIKKCDTISSYLENIDLDENSR